MVSKILKTIKTGLKVAAVSIVAGILSGIISTSLTWIGVLTENTLGIIISILLIIPISIYTMGWVATKLWKWK